MNIHLIASLHYVMRIFLGVLAIEAIAFAVPDLHPLWALISLIIVTDPQIKTAWVTFRMRFINTILGCIVGLVFLFAFGVQYIGILAVGVSASALISTYLTKLQQGWRIGPVTTALIMSTGMTEQSTQTAYELALGRTAGIIIGSVIALLITLSLSRVWMPPEEKKKKKKNNYCR